jgi:hypothetical protein
MIDMKIQRTSKRHYPYLNQALFVKLTRIRALRILFVLRNDMHDFNLRCGFYRTTNQCQHERKWKLKLLKMTANKLDKALVHINECCFDSDYKANQEVFVLVDALRNKYKLFIDVDIDDLDIPIEIVDEYHESIIPLVDSVIDKIIIDTDARLRVKHPYLSEFKQILK